MWGRVQKFTIIIKVRNWISMVSVVTLTIVIFIHISL